MLLSSRSVGLTIALLAVPACRPQPAEESGWNGYQGSESRSRSATPEQQALIKGAQGIGVAFCSLQEAIERLPASIREPSRVESSQATGAATDSLQALIMARAAVANLENVLKDRINNLMKAQPGNSADPIIFISPRDQLSEATDIAGALARIELGLGNAMGFSSEHVGRVLADGTAPAEGVGVAKHTGLLVLLLHYVRQMEVMQMDAMLKGFSVIPSSDPRPETPR